MGIRIYGDNISLDCAGDFAFIKGVYGCKSNGETIEKLIELSLPAAAEKAKTRKNCGKC